MKRFPNGDVQLDDLDEKLLEAVKDTPKSRQELLKLAPTERTGQRRLETLLKYGYLERVEHGAYGLGDNGHAIVSPSPTLLGPPFHDEKIKTLITMLPTAAHRSLYRLTLDGIVAKYLLLDKYDNNWPCSIIGGKGKEFKTGLAWSLCILVDELDPGYNIRAMQFPSPKEITVRRQKGKDKNLDLDISPLLSEPFVCFDEFDKSASKDLKRQAELFLDGRRDFTFENKMVTNHAYPFITLNTTPEQFGIPGPYIRRSVVVNAERLQTELTSVDLVAEGIHRFQDSESDAPRISLKHLAPPENPFPPEDYPFLRELFMHNVQEGYENQVDTKPLELLTMGRLVLLGSNDLKEAMLSVVWDRLECLETMQGTRTGWRERVAGIWARHQEQIPEEVKEAAERAREGYEKAKEIREQEDALEKGKTALTVEVDNLLDGLSEETICRDSILPLESKLHSLKQEITSAKNSNDLHPYQEQLKGLIDVVTKEKAKTTKLNNKKSAVRQELDCLELYLSSYCTHTGDPGSREKASLQMLNERLTQADNPDALDLIRTTIQTFKSDLKQKRDALEEKETRIQAERETRERLEKEHLTNKLLSQLKEIREHLAPHSSQLNAMKAMNSLIGLENEIRTAQWANELRTIEEHLQKRIVPGIDQLIAGFALEIRKKEFADQIQENIDALAELLREAVEAVSEELERLGCGFKLSSGAFKGLDGVTYWFSWTWTGDIEEAGPLIEKRLEELKTLQKLLDSVQTLPDLENLQKRYEQPYLDIAKMKKGTGTGA